MTGPSVPQGPSDRLPTRQVAPAALERVVQILTQQYANDLLTETDLETRLDRAYRANTLPELEAVIADLPAMASATVPGPAAREAPTRVAAWFSGQERKITGTVPRSVQVRARAGYVELDLTRASFAPGVTTIDARPFMGYVQVFLPPGIRVESEGHALFGFYAVKGRDSLQATEAESVVRLTGRAIFGFVECFPGRRMRRRDRP